MCLESVHTACSGTVNTNDWCHDLQKIVNIPSSPADFFIAINILYVSTRNKKTVNLLNGKIVSQFSFTKFVLIIFAFFNKTVVKFFNVDVFRWPLLLKQKPFEDQASLLYIKIYSIFEHTVVCKPFAQIVWPNTVIVWNGFQFQQ